MNFKFLPYVASGLFMALPLYAYEVPTEKQNKNILLEEYTGIHCGFCPQGHAIANSLLVAQHASTYVIAIHDGHYAAPSPNEPDFRTQEGTVMNNTIGAEFYKQGYPSASVNRHAFAGTSIVTGRGDWVKNAKSAKSETAPVNLWMKSEFDGSNRKLTVKVEGYYTEDVEINFNLLNVALLQNNIEGPQSGGTVVPYIHNHMFRAYITPLWGDTIKAPKIGEYFTREYEYTLPADINKVELKAEDIELVAFVCEDKTEVLNVIGGKPVYLNYEKPLKAALLSPDQDINTNYAYNFFDARLKNESNQTITSAEFDVKINGNSQTVNWIGNISSFKTLPIQIKVQPYAITTNNEYEISLLKINNQSIEGGIVKGSFAAPAESTAELILELQTDLYADDNIFAIKDQDGKVVEEFGPYEVGKKKVYKEELSLESNKIYCFEITDKWGDGVQTPRGYFKLHNKEDQSMVAQQFDIKQYGHRFFFKTVHLSGIDEVGYGKTISWVEEDKLKVRFTALESGRADIALYTISGELVSHNSLVVSANEEYIEELLSFSLLKGFYLVRLSQGGKSETVKVSFR